MFEGWGGGIVQPLLDGAKAILYTMALAMPRAIGAMTIFSFLGANALGGALVRNGVAAALAILVYPVASRQVIEANLSMLPFAMATAKELALGMLIGAVPMVMFWSLQAVGNFIDNQRGATAASSMDPMLGEQASPLGIFLTQTMVAVFFCTGLFGTFLTGLYASYEIWPITSFWPTIDADFADFFVAQFVQISALALLLAGPVIAIMFLAEIGLGFISRFAPQLNVFFLSMPVKSGVASLMLVVYLTIIIGFFSDQLRELDLRMVLERLFK